MYKVYKIVNTANNMVYIGVTRNSLLKRFTSHKTHARKALRDGEFTTYLYNAMNSIGVDKFSIHLLKSFSDETSMLQMEKVLVAHFKSLGLAYNILPGGVMYCQPHLNKPEARVALKERMMGNTQSKGYKHTPEALEAIRERNRTRVRLPKPPLEEVLACKSSREVFEKFKMSRSEFYRVRKKAGLV